VNGQVLLPGILRAKIDINAGQRSVPSVINLRRAERSKLTRPFALSVVGALLSIDAGAGPKPWFTAFRDDMKPSDRASVIEAWRIANAQIGK
jgi:hypothetical protein